MRTTVAILVLTGVLALPTLAGGQAAPSTTRPAPAARTAQADQPQPVVSQPVAGRVSIRVRGGQATRKLRYVVRGGYVAVEGRSRPFVAGQVATLAIYRRGRLVATRGAPIAPSGSGGLARFRFRARRAGLVKLVISHAATVAQSAFRSRAARIKVIAPRAGQGARGTHVLLLQRGLRRLGFAVPVTGHYDAGTARAVLAFRKTNGLGWSGFATRRVFALVLRNRGAFRPKYPRGGRHVEFDWSRQVLAVIQGGRARRVYHASSGKPSTPTVFGTFRFYRKERGTNSLGMVHSNYFIRGYAIHGYRSVPNYPASHGCIRVPIANADDVDRQISLGATIFVYR